jgi:hypothetical protein
MLLSWLEKLGVPMGLSSTSMLQRRPQAGVKVPAAGPQLLSSLAGLNVSLDTGGLGMPGIETKGFVDIRHRTL